MKFSVLALLLCTSFSAFAQLSRPQQLSIIENIAKNDRRDLWRSRHLEVSSDVTKPSRAKVDELIRDNGQTENPLVRNEISSIYSCLNSPRNCVVYVIDIYSESYGGSGSSRRWVLLNTNTGKYRSIHQIVWVE